MIFRKFQIKTALVTLPFLLLSYSTLHAQKADSGQVYFNINLPEPFYLVINSNLVEAKLVAPGDTLTLPVDNYHFIIVSRYIDDFDINVYIEKDRVERISETFETFRVDHNSTFRQLNSRTNLFVNTDPASTIYVNGKESGTGQFTTLLNPGRYTIKSVHPEAGSLTKSVTIGLAETEIINRFNINQKTDNMGYYMLPAGGYLMTEQFDKAVLTYLVLGGLVASHFTLEQKMRNDPLEYHWDHSKLKSIQKTSIAAFLGVYVLTTFDGLRKPKEGFPGKEIELNFEDLRVGNKAVQTAGLRVNF